MVLVIKNPPASAEDTRDVDSVPGSGRSPGVSHSNIPPWEIPWTEEPGRLQSVGHQRVGHS